MCAKIANRFDSQAVVVIFICLLIVVGFPTFILGLLSLGILTPYLKGYNSYRDCLWVVKFYIVLFVISGSLLALSFYPIAKNHHTKRPVYISMIAFSLLLVSIGFLPIGLALVLTVISVGLREYTWLQVILYCIPIIISIIAFIIAVTLFFSRRK